MPIYLLAKRELVKNGLAIAFANKIMTKDEGKWNESDFKIISPENDLIKVEDIRSLISEIYLKPIEAKRKVMIIDDADKMNLNAQNALLKVLEEPPAYATLILIVSHKEKMIKTVLSRMTEITFDHLTKEELKQIVGKEIDYELARGSASKAFSILEDDYFAITKELIPIIDQKDFIKLNKKMIEIKQSGTEIEKVLEILKLMYYKDLKENTYIKVKNIQLIEQTIKNLNRNANVDLALDKLMIELCRR